MKKIITIIAFLTSFVSAQTFSGDAVEGGWHSPGFSMDKVSGILTQNWGKIDNLSLQDKVDKEGVLAELLWKTTADKAEKTNSSFMSGEKPDRLEIVLEKDGSGKIFLYKDQILIGRVRCKTNSKTEGEYRQPGAGEYKVFDKKKVRVSTDPKFEGAKLPNALLIDHSRGIWIHQGDITGQSGGCVRVSEPVARQLYRLVDIGTTVVVKKQP